MASYKLNDHVLAALGPPEQEGTGFDDLVETLSHLTVAVVDPSDEVRSLRWSGSARPPPAAAPSSVEG